MERGGRSWEGCEKILVESHGGGERSIAYIVDLRKGEASQVGGTLLNHGVMDGLMGVGCVIYAFGKRLRGKSAEVIDNPDEQDLIHSVASYLDLSVTPLKWRRLESEMINIYRFNPKCASLGDTVFVFGGTRILSEASPAAAAASFGEYLDTASSKWHPIPIPEPKPEGFGYPILSDPANARLICYLYPHRSLYAYYPSDPVTPWVRLDSHHESFFWRFEVAPSVVDDVIYSYCDREAITAYDIRTNKYLDVSWSSHTPFSPALMIRYPFFGFVYLGNNILCVISSLPFKDPDTGRYKAHLHLFRFRVCHDSPQQVTVTPLSLGRILLPGLGLPRPLNFIPL